MAVAEATFAGPASRPRREPERWQVRGGVTDARMRSWTEILATTHLAFDVRPTFRTPDQFHGGVTRRAIGDLMLLDCVASPFLARHSHAMMTSTGRGEENVLGFQFVFKGVELVRESDRQLALQAGDMVLWDGTQPTEVEIVEAFYKRTLLFPRDQVFAVCPRLAELSAPPSLDGSASARLLVRYINALALELP